MSKKLLYKGSIKEMTGEDTDKAVRFINKCKYCVLGTVNPDSGVHLSILTTQEKQELTEVWYITRTSTQKVVDLRNDSRCEVLYTDRDNQITLTGHGEIVTESMLKKALWNPWVKLYIPEGPQSEDMSLIKFIPDTINAIIE